MENNQYITVKDVATILGVTEIHVRNLLKKGKIPYVNVGTSSRRLIRIEKKAMDKFLSEKEV